MSIDVEQAVIGACLCSEQAYWRVADILVPEDFGDGRLAKLYALIRERARTQSVFDAVTICDVEPITLGPLAIDLASAQGWRIGSVRAYAELVAQNAQARRIQLAGQQIARLSGPDALIEAQRIIAACAPRHAGSVRHIREYLRESTLEMQRRVDATEQLTGVTTGMDAIDEITDGFQPGDLIVLAARPSVGKTALALQFAIAAARAQVRSLVFSLEMSGLQLTDRVQSHIAQVNATGIRRPKLLDNSDFQRLFKASVEINQLPLQIDQTAAITLEAMSARARQVHATDGLGLIVLDYLQLMTRPKAQTDAEALGILTGGLKRLAKELNVPLIALSQLSRAGDGRRPGMADLRGSGSIEQDADVVMFLHREDDKARDRALLIIDKQRNGETGDFHLDADLAHMRFVVSGNQQSQPAAKPSNGFGAIRKQQNLSWNGYQD